MAKFRMKYFGSAEGKSGKTYHFDKDQIIEAKEGEFDEVTADLVAEEKKKDEGKEKKKDEGK
jgi:hypothetical protein